MMGGADGLGALALWHGANLGTQCGVVAAIAATVSLGVPALAVPACHRWGGEDWHPATGTLTHCAVALLALHVLALEPGFAVRGFAALRLHVEHVQAAAFGYMAACLTRTGIGVVDWGMSVSEDADPDAPPRKGQIEEARDALDALTQDRAESRRLVRHEVQKDPRMGELRATKRVAGRLWQERAR